MNRAITGRFLREALWPALAACVGIVFFVVLFVWAMQEMGPELMSFLSSVGFLKKMLELAYGISLSGEVSSNVLYSIAWLHPVVLALSWGVLIAIATRQTAGEIERGTAELLLTLPVSRLSVLLSGAVTWMAVAAVVSASPLAGVFIGSRLFEPFDTIQFGRFAQVMVNFFALNLAVAALATLAGTCVMRRGVAVSLVAALLIGCVAMNFLESFLTFVEHVRFLNLLNYYRPSAVVRDGVWPVGHMAILGFVSAASLGAASIVLARRDIPVN